MKGVKTMGTTRCSYCHRFGHTRRACPELHAGDLEALLRSELRQAYPDTREVHFIPGYGFFTREHRE